MCATEWDFLKPHYNFNFDVYAYVNLDDNLACFGDLTDEEIIRNVTPDDKNEQLAIEEDSNDTVMPRITTATALECLNKLRLFYQQSQSESVIYLAYLEKIEDNLENSKKLNQTTLDKYFVNN